MDISQLKETQPKILEQFNIAKQKNRLSHAYLFHGIKGTLKFETALYVSMMLYCKEEEPCGKCSSCQRILNQTHPNVFVIEPEGKVIKKEQITRLQEDFSKTMVEEGPKIYIIRHIDLINTAAANSLLKFIEEPFSETYGFMTTENMSSVLPTLISRSQNMTFSKMSQSHIIKQLINDGYDSDVVNIIATLSASYEQAKTLLDNEATDSLVKYCESVFETYCQNGDLILWWESVKDDITYDMQIFKLFLDLVSLYLKDTFQILEPLFKHSKEYIECLNANLSKEKRMDLIEQILKNKRQLNTYINAQLSMQVLFLMFEESD
jgi:DNA polymerase-3 subunit delta'